jgi:hypothetical protein
MQSTKPGYPRIASILSLVGGTVILLSGLLFAAVSVFILPGLSFANVHAPPGLSPAAIPGIVSGFVGVMGAFGLVSGAIVLISSIMLLTGTGQSRTWSVLILVFSILSFIGLGGFVVGAVLGVVGGALALRRKSPTA